MYIFVLRNNNVTKIIIIEQSSLTITFDIVIIETNIYNRFSLSFSTIQGIKKSKRR